jgi:PAS domain S-box-containing protein
MESNETSRKAETSAKITSQENEPNVEETYKAFVESVAQAVLLVDDEGKIQVANKESEKIFGCDAIELSGRRLTSFISDGIDIFSNQRGLAIETLGFRKNGETVDLEVVRGEFVHENHNYHTLLIREIGHRKQTESTLQSISQRYEALLDSINAFTWEGEAFPFRLTYVSPQVEKVYGYPVERWVNDAEFWKKILHPEDRDWAIAYCDEEIRKKRSYQLTYRVITADGKTVWVRDTANAVLKEGDVLSIRGLVNDVTDYMRTENELLMSKQLYRDLVEKANDIIYSHDMEGNIISLNEVGLRLTGYTREEALQMKIFDIITPEYLEKAHEMIANKTEGEEKTVYDLEIKRKDGSCFMVEVSTNLIYQSGKPVGVQGIARDVTERKMLQTQLHQAQKMETVGRLAGGIAHDFNNLLTVILGKADLALMQLKDSSGNLLIDIEVIRNAAEKAAAMTQQILAFSRKQVLQPRIVDLNTIVINISKILKRLISENIELETSLAEGLGRVSADPSRIEQVIMNLAVNARDAMPEGGKLTIETANANLDTNYSRQHLNARPGRYVMLAVSDNGVGINNEVLKHIFEPFYTTKESGRGTGLGLATVYGIVKQSGGYIWVYSEENVGTTFKIYLPLVDEPQKMTLPSQSASQLSEGNETILLVEDDDSIRAIVKEMMILMGYKVIDAPNGIKALKIAQETTEPIDLVITDVIMPGMSGRQLAEQLKRLNEEIKVLYMTGYSDEAIVRHGILEQGLESLQKPFTFESLSFKIREMLDYDSSRQTSQ